jgi:hypothetical protein
METKEARIFGQRMRVTRGGRMAADDLSLLLATAPDEGRASKKCQYAFMETYQSLRAANIETRARMLGGGPTFRGEFFIPLAQAIGPTLGVVLVAWLHGRSGRKVRVKFGDVEAEGRSPKEIEQLLKRIAEFKDRKQKPGGDE